MSMFGRTMIKRFQRYLHLSAESEPISILKRMHRNSSSLGECKQVHAMLITSNSLSEIYLTNTLLALYSNHQDLQSARKLFDQMPHRNEVCWTSMISAYLHHGFFETALHLFKEMLKSNARPNQYTLSIGIRACTSYGFLDLGEQIHCQIVRVGLQCNEFVGSSLLQFYFKVGGSVIDACQIFHGLYKRDTVTWNVMISGYAEAGDRDEVFQLILGMQVLDGLVPNDSTVSSLLKCCCFSSEVKQVHGFCVKIGLQVDILVGNALVDSYGKCGDMTSGRKLFKSIEVKDKFVWSSIISGYARNGNGEEAIALFKDMCIQGMKLDQYALSSVLGACAASKDFKVGTQVHVHMIKHGYQHDHFVANCLIRLYASIDIGEAEKLFKRIDEKDIVAWNSMITGYSQMKEGSSYCICTFRKLCQTTAFTPDEITLIGLLKSCQTISDKVIGVQIQALKIKLSVGYKTSVGNAVINMYSNFGALDDAYRAFVDIADKDVISWSSIIGNYQQNGFELEALMLCKEMLANGVNFTSFSLSSCVTACAELSSLDLGKQFHAFSFKSSCGRDFYVGSSIIDMYAKCGNMLDSEVAFKDLESPNEVAYNALISGFAQHGKALDAIRLFKDMENMGLLPNAITFLAVLSGCSHVGLIDESLYFFNLMHQSYNIKPEIEHYSCLIDVFSRAGRVEEAYQILEKDASMEAWRTLLSACRNYGNLEIAEKCAMHIMKLDPHAHSSYVLLSNIYSIKGKWEEALDMRQKMADIGVKKNPGSSMIFRNGSRDFEEHIGHS